VDATAVAEAVQEKPGCSSNRRSVCTITPMPCATRRPAGAGSDGASGHVPARCEPFGIELVKRVLRLRVQAPTTIQIIGWEDPDIQARLLLIKVDAEFCC
jgi:hypothetical protein